MKHNLIAALRKVLAGDVIDFQKYKQKKQDEEGIAKEWADKAKKAFEKETSGFKKDLKDWDVKFEFYPPDGSEPTGLAVIEIKKDNPPNPLANDLNHIAQTFIKKHFDGELDPDSVEYYYPGHRQYPNYKTHAWYIKFKDPLYDNMSQL